MKIYWRNAKGLYSSHLRLNLWKPLASEFNCKLLDKKPFLKPDVVVFQKMFDSKAQEELKYWKRKGVLTVFDINVNYFELWGKIPWNLSQQQHDDAWEMSRIADIVTTTSEYITQVLRQRFDKVFTITESIDLNHWNAVKHHKGPIKTLMLCAVSSKIDSLLLIKNPLEMWSREYDCELLLISDQKIDLNINIKQRWESWHLDTAKNMFLEADLQIAPRDMSMSYNQGHTLTKIAQGMAMQIPAIGSALPSYCLSPALIARSESDWIKHFEKLNDPLARQENGKLSANYVNQNHSPEMNFKKFIDIIDENLS